MRDRQIVLLGGLPDRFEVGVVDRPLVVEQGLHRDRPFGIAPFADLAHRFRDLAGRGDDRALEAVRRGGAEIGHVAVIGADQRHLDRGVGVADRRGPGRGDEEMPVGALDIHVVQAVLGVVVLDAGAGAQPAAPHPAVARAGLRLRFAQRALIDLFVEAVDRALAAALLARADRDLVAGQLREARSEARIDIAVEHLGAGVDVGVDIVDAKAVFHRLSPPSNARYRYRTARPAQASLIVHRPLCIGGAFAYPTLRARV